MGMAASQARLLTITSRIHDVEYQAQSIQNAKIQLATQQDQVYQKYLDALDEHTLTIKNNAGERIPANFNTLCGINAVQATKLKRYVLRDDKNAIIVDDEIANGYKAYKNANGRGDAYEFAYFMMGSQDTDKFFGDKYAEADLYAVSFNELFNKKININELPSELSAIVDTLADKLYQLDTYNQVRCYGNMSKEKAVEKIRHDLLGISKAEYDEDNAPFENTGDSFLRITYNIRENLPKITDNKKTIETLLDEVDNLFAKLEHQFYLSYSEDVYKGANNGSSDDFDEDDFWYYVNMYKQIEANGGSYRLISDYDGIDDIGDASTDGDWLKRMIESGKITIDNSSIDKKTGKITFSSTGVSSDTYLENTTTSTIDKSKLAKAEAEYEHETKLLDQKDKKFDMDLSKLETERKALTTEYESVKKVVQENIERTFGIFS